MVKSDYRDDFGPALALIQIREVPAGLRALDALVKEAAVAVLERGTVQCGHYLIAFGGELEPVARSFDRALEVAKPAVWDAVLLPDAEPRIAPAFRRARIAWPAEGDALGVVEAPSCPALLACVDAALKGAWVELVELRLADGLGGKAIATLWGDIHDVQAAAELAQRAFAGHARSHRPTGDELAFAVIANADEETKDAVRAGTRFFGEWRG
jgi:microcompartment protein CcmL/EutN